MYISKTIAQDMTELTFFFHSNTNRNSSNNNRRYTPYDYKLGNRIVILNTTRTTASGIEDKFVRYTQPFAHIELDTGLYKTRHLDFT